MSGMATDEHLCINREHAARRFRELATAIETGTLSGVAYLAIENGTGDIFENAAWFDEGNTLPDPPNPIYRMALACMYLLIRAGTKMFAEHEARTQPGPIQ